MRLGAAASVELSLKCKSVALQMMQLVDVVMKGSCDDEYCCCRLLYLCNLLCGDVQQLNRRVYSALHVCHIRLCTFRQDTIDKITKHRRTRLTRHEPMLARGHTDHFHVINI